MNISKHVSNISIVYQNIVFLDTNFIFYILQNCYNSCDSHGITSRWTRWSAPTFNGDRSPLLGFSDERNSRTGRFDGDQSQLEHVFEPDLFNSNGSDSEVPFTYLPKANDGENPEQILYEEDEVTPLMTCDVNLNNPLPSPPLQIPSNQVETIQECSTSV